MKKRKTKINPNWIPAPYEAHSIWWNKQTATWEYRKLVDPPNDLDTKAFKYYFCPNTQEYKQSNENKD